MREVNEIKMTIFPGERRKKEASKKARIGGNEVLWRSVGLFLARAVPMTGLAPFGVSFLAMERKPSLGMGLSLLFTALGYLSLGQGAQLRYIAVCLGYVGILLCRRKKEEPATMQAAGIVGVLTFLFGLLTRVRGPFSVGQILFAMIDGGLVMLGVLVFDQGRRFLKEKDCFSRMPTNEEKRCLFLMTGIVLLSFQGLPLSDAFSLANLVGLFLLGAATISGGLLVGTVAGLGLGILLGMNGELLSVMAAYGGCGLVCGSCARYGKYVVACGLAMSGLFFGYYAEVFPFYEVLLGAGALLFVPQGGYEALQRFTNFSAQPAENPYKERVNAKLSRSAASFHALAEAFARLAEPKKQVDKQEVAVLFDTVADRVCRDCSRVGECWETEHRATHTTMLHFLEIMEQKGQLKEKDVMEGFAGHCLRVGRLVSECNRLFEIYKLNQAWQNKLCENRALAGEQFRGIGEILQRMKSQLEQELSLDTLAAEEIRCRLEKQGVIAREVQVSQGIDGARKVQLQHKSKDKEEAEAIVPGILRGVLGSVFVPSASPVTEKGRMQTVTYYQAPRHYVEIGVAAAGKWEENGDSHLTQRLQGRKFLAVISDGMGTGPRAGQESGAIVSLLEQFMDAGFEREVAVGLINSLMVMKSAREAFATVDLCMIDLDTGEAEFVKNGAEPSYIKRKNNTETIRAASLPVGLLSGVEVEAFAHKLNVGDTIVMVSDGLVPHNGSEGWLRQAVEQAADGIPVQELADQIMEKAELLQEGKPEDDRTVLVLRLSKA